MKAVKITTTLSCLLISSSLAIAEETPKILEEVLVTGGKADIKTLGGSAQLLDEEALEEFDYTDLNQVMTSLPGVYIRQEDGYGLRPNIGIRGATSERSQKITLMEDGVLIAPAPYTAPAAYYIPNVGRMSALEVVKGPAAILHGPHTVGGAVNMATRAIPEEALGEIDFTLGSDAFRKLRVFYGDNTENFGYWVEGLTFGGDGFKELRNGDDTGFVRNDFNAKLQWRTDETADLPQQFTLKLGYADEDSDETYLGLTDADFRADPYQRYAASANDKFESDHSQVHLDHVISFSETLKLNSKVYWNKFNRSWNKFDGFIGQTFVDENGYIESASASNTLNSGHYTREIALLKGDVDSNGSAKETLDITNNDRTYGSYGVQTAATLDLYFGEFEHEVTVGGRFHHDYVDRHHKVAGFLMQDGVLVSDGQTYNPKALNHAETDAFALFIQDKLNWQDWEITAGVRFENIEGEAEDLEEGTKSTNSQSIAIPGLGVYWQFTDSIGFLAGINKGFSPAGPGADDNVDPEESTNVEYGIRYQEDVLYVEAIGFYSDYDNLLGRCRASDAGCELGDEFNGDAVEISGLELISQYEWMMDNGWSIPVALSYTYTDSSFDNSFNSSFSQWGEVTEGDELPYLPKNQARVQVGLENDIWSLLLAWKHQDAMREIAGSGSIYDNLHTDTLSTLDASLTWLVNESLTTQFTVDNITDEADIVSHRPFGARPNKPRSFNARVKYEF